MLAQNISIETAAATAAPKVVTEAAPILTFGTPAAALAAAASAATLASMADWT